jgi:signal transduction histidine kinase
MTPDVPQDPGGQPVWDRLFPMWDAYFAVVALAVGIAVAADHTLPTPRRLIAVGAIALAVALYAGPGGRYVRRGPTGRGPFLFIAAETVQFAVAELGSDNTGFLLFALTPMIFLSVSMRLAVPIVVVANLIPIGAAVLRDGASVFLLTHLGPIALISIVFALFIGFWIDRVVEQSKERGALIAELEASRAEVARLSHEAGAAAERARLAGEIHDTLAQGFTSIITLLQAADPELADERLALAVRTARENLAESRTLIAALSPSALASGSLPDAVRRQVSRLIEESGLTATCRVTGEPRELPVAVEVVVLRAAQEALTNARRHACAQDVGVLLAYGETTVRLVVRDDGHGFDPATATGFGLRGMRARAEQVDGILTVHSVRRSDGVNRSDDARGSGSTIELEVPV